MSATTLALCGASLASMAVYVHSLRERRSRTLAIWKNTPPSNAEHLREQIAAQERHALPGSAAVFCKLVGETWAPSHSLVPDRFGKTHLSVSTSSIERISRCVWEKRSTGIAGEEEWGWSCKEQEGKTRTDVVRGGAIYLVDSASMYARLGCGVRTRQLQAQADELKGRVEGARELLIVMGRDLPEAARYEARRVVSRWEVQLGERAEQLRGAAAADRALGDEGGVAGRLEAQRLRFSVRIDEGSLDAAGLFSVNHVKFRPVGAGGGGGGDGMPPPVPPRRRGGKQTFETVVGVTETERVIASGAPMCAMGYATLERGSARGDELVLRRMPGQPLVVEMGSDLEVTARLQGRVGGLVAVEVLFGMSGAALLALAMRSYLTKDQDRR